LYLHSYVDLELAVHEHMLEVLAPAAEWMKEHT
jgi:hypothetical protein